MFGLLLQTGLRNFDWVVIAVLAIVATILIYLPRPLIIAIIISRPSTWSTNSIGQRGQ